MNKSQKLYAIKAYNGYGGGIGTYYVVATGVNKAKAAVKESEKVIKKVVALGEYQVIITQ